MNCVPLDSAHEDSIPFWYQSATRKNENIFTLNLLCSDSHRCFQSSIVSSIYAYTIDRYHFRYDYCSSNLHSGNMIYRTLYSLYIVIVAHHGLFSVPPLYLESPLYLLIFTVVYSAPQGKESLRHTLQKMNIRRSNPAFSYLRCSQK